MEAVGYPLLLLVERSGRVEGHPFGEGQSPFSLVGKHTVECQAFACFLIISFRNVNETGKELADTISQVVPGY